MILVDTSVWVDHLRRADAGRAALLEERRELVHPFVIGEIGCAALSDCSATIDLLGNLPAAALAEHDEVLTVVERHRRYHRGIGLVDAHLLASVASMSATLLWTRHRRLQSTATALCCAYAATKPH